MEKINDYGLPEEKLFFTLADIARIGLMSYERLKVLIKGGRIKALKNGKNYRIQRSELIRYIDEDMQFTPLK